MEVGFLGLGIMGKAMSMNLLRNGFKVTVWNRTLSKCDELVEHGASIGETPAAIVKKCKYTIAMLSDPSAALSVVFDKDGALEQMCSGKGYIDMSTVDANTSSKISEAITKKGGFFLEAPVSGSKKPAEDGQLVILAAGEKALYEEAIPAFNVMGKKSFFLGHVGSGAKMKLVINMIMGSVLNAFSEGLVLADRSGLNQKTLLDVLELGGIANPMFKHKGPTMIQNNYSTAFPLKHQQKDMRLALALGDENAVSMPVAAAANEVMFSLHLYILFPKFMQTLTCPFSSDGKVWPSHEGGPRIKSREGSFLSVTWHSRRPEAWGWGSKIFQLSTRL